jgi:hypothetical protein
MADEKVIRISGDATGFGNEINRAAKDAKEAFADIGLDDIFEKADRGFDNLQEKIQSISDELKREKQEADDLFNRRREEAGDDRDSRKENVNDQIDYNKRYSEALQKWQDFLDKLEDSIDKANQNPNNSGNAGGGSGGNGGGGGNNNPNNSNNPNSPNNPQNNINLARLLGGSGSTIGNVIGRILPGGVGRSLGGGLGNLLEMGGSRLGGSLAASGAAALPIAAVAGIVVASVAALKMLYGMGQEDWRTESKVNTTFAINRDTFGKGGDKFGLGNVEFKEFILAAAKSRGVATDIEDIAKKELMMMRGYGVNQQQAQAFDKYTFQNVTGKNSADIIVEILARSEKQGILGVSQNDFSRLPEKIEQVSSIMSFQKMSGERVDSLSAMNFMTAGNQIGGRFGDDRASEVYGRMNESIRNPTSPGMKAYIFEMLKRANPGASYTDLLAMQEDGSSGKNLKAILPGFANMPQGELRRLALRGITGGNQQDANRLDNAGSLSAMINAANQKGLSATETQSKYDQAMKRTSENLAATDELFKRIENKVVDVAERLIFRPINDLIRAMEVGNYKSGFNSFGQLMSTPFIIQAKANETAKGFVTGGNNKVTPKPSN